VLTMRFSSDSKMQLSQHYFKKTCKTPTCRGARPRVTLEIERVLVPLLLQLRVQRVPVHLGDLRRRERPADEPRKRPAASARSRPVFGLH